MTELGPDPRGTVIIVISSSSRERAAFTALCGSRDWVVTSCESIRSATRLFQRTRPRTVLMRHKLSDGFSDHLLAELTANGRHAATHRIVIVAAGTSTSTEARQLALGADCVLRDPIPTDVLLAYLDKYQRAPRTEFPGDTSTTATVAFAGGVLHRSERRLQNGHHSAALTPREVELAELLARDAGQVVTYETLYSEILNRGFQGDTSNMRVLLGKLAASANSVGLSLRQWVEVIPKAGYRYHADGPPPRPSRNRSEQEAKPAR